MISSISWNNYWALFAVSAAIYYLIVFAVFYRNEIYAVLKGKLKPSTLRLFALTLDEKKWTGNQYTTTEQKLSDERIHFSVAGKETKETYTQNILFPEATFLKEVSEVPAEETELLPIVQSLLDELKAFMEQAAQVKYRKDLYLYSLSLLLGKYPAVRGTATQLSVNHFITTESEHICSIHLSEEEVNGLWKG